MRSPRRSDWHHEYLWSLLIQVEVAGELLVAGVADGEFVVVAGTGALAIGQKVAAHGFGGLGADGTDATGEEATEKGLVVQTTAIVEGDDNAQLAIIAEQTISGTHQFGKRQGVGMARQRALLVGGLQGIYEERRA